MKSMTTIHLSFSEIRRVCQCQIAYTEKACPWVKNVSLRTSFNNELELLDLDWDEFVLPWVDNFGIPIYDQFSYHDYFWEIRFLPFFWFESFINSLKTGIPFEWFPTRPIKPDLTVGDFAASVLSGRFIKRENLRVILSPIYS